MPKAAARQAGVPERSRQAPGASMRRRNHLAPRGRTARLGNLAANLLWSLVWISRACVRRVRRTQRERQQMKNGK